MGIQWNIDVYKRQDETGDKVQGFEKEREPQALTPQD